MSYSPYAGIVPGLLSLKYVIKPLFNMYLPRPVSTIL